MITITTYVLNNEADHNRAMVELRKLNVCNYPEQTLRIEVHAPDQKNMNQYIDADGWEGY